MLRRHGAAVIPLGAGVDAAAALKCWRPPYAAAFLLAAP